MFYSFFFFFRDFLYRKVVEKSAGRHAVSQNISCVVNSRYLRNNVDFWSVHGIMNSSGLLQSKRSPKGFKRP